MKIRLFALMILLMISTSAFADRDRGYYRPNNHHYSDNYNSHKNYFYQNTPKHAVYYNNYDRYPYYNRHNYTKHSYGYYDRNYYGRPTHRQYYNDAVGVILGVGILGYMLGADH